MSFNSNNHFSWSSGNVSWKAAIGSVAAGAPITMKHSGGTRFEDYSSVGTWTVKGLKMLDEGTASIESIPFPHQNSSKWCMILTNNKDGIRLGFLLKECETELVLRAKLKADEILPTCEKREVFPRKSYSLKRGEKSEMVLIRKPITDKEDCNQDELTLECEICIQCIIQDELAKPHASIVKGLDEMLHKEILTDFELRAEGTVLKAHRALLSVRSPYFAAMLQPHTKEAKEGFVQILDVKPGALKQVLLYLYTGAVPSLKDIPWELLIAADKYQLQQLKRECETHLAGRLTVENAAQTAANASVYSCDLLWDCAVRFIKRNLLPIMSSPGWTEAIATHPEAVARISELMA